MVTGHFKSEMAAIKYFINKIDMNHPGQCYLIRNQEGGIGANMPASFHGTLHKCNTVNETMTHKIRWHIAQHQCLIVALVILQLPHAPDGYVAISIV